MSTDLAARRKHAAKLARSADALANALKELEGAAKRLDSAPFAVAPAVADVKKALKPIAACVEGLNGLDVELNALEQAGRDATEKGRARLAAELHDALTSHGLSLQGRLPTPTVGPLTLEFVFGGKPAVKVHYGPKVALLQTVKLDPKAVADAVVSELRALEGTDIDGEAFLRELHVAWRVAQARLGLAPTDRAPIQAVHAALAAGRQSHTFWDQPNRGAVAYGRIKFSHDLARLRTRRADIGELALTVATREQTKNPNDHLWVDGTHYAFISFR